MKFREYINEARFLKHTTSNMLQSYASKQEITDWMNANAGTINIEKMETAVKNKDIDVIKDLLK